MPSKALMIGGAIFVCLCIALVVYFTTTGGSPSSSPDTSAPSPTDTSSSPSPSPSSVPSGTPSSTVPSGTPSSTVPSGTPSSTVPSAPLANGQLPAAPTPPGAPPAAPQPPPNSGVVNGAAAGTAGSIAGINWASHLNYDYPTAFLQYLPNQTRTQCATACANNSACKAFVTGGLVTATLAGDCVLKNAFATSSLTPNTNLNVFSKP